jgi:hypothetical protein
MRTVDLPWRGGRFVSSAEKLAREVLHRIRMRREEQLHRLPRLRVATAGALPVAASPRVFYLCPDDDRPRGGLRVIYRHVDTLNAAGITAVAVHHKSGFACSWFEHSTAVSSASDITVTPRDILVIPELYGPDLDRLPLGPRVVIFNQGAYRTFAGLSSERPGAPYHGVAGLEAILVVSDDSAEYLHYAFPWLPIERVRNAIDGRIFYPSPAQPGRRLAVMPRRRPGDWAQLLHLLRARGVLGLWDIVIIDHRSERETAETLRNCAIFLSFSEQEGFGLPPAEAMACGCYVIGYTGFGGREIFDPATSSPIEEGNVLAFAKAAERALLAGDEELQMLRQRGLAASARILRDYSPERQRDELLAFFGSLFSQHRSRDRNVAAGPSAPKAIASAARP